MAKTVRAPFTLFLFRFGTPLIGIALLSCAGFLFHNSWFFVTHAIPVTATVIEPETRFNSLLLGFTDQSGKYITFSLHNNGEQTHKRGAKMAVSYLPGEPENARRERLDLLWMPAVVLAFFGICSILIGIPVLQWEFFDHRRERHIIKHGVRLSTKMHVVETDENEFRPNGEQTRWLVTRWVDPKTNVTHLFKSEKIYFDPSIYVRNKKIDVYVIWGDPDRYYVDLSLLPGIEDLKKIGVAIDTTFDAVRKHVAYKDDSEIYTYRIVSHWSNPDTGKQHQFWSDELSVDPTPYLKTDRVKVFIKRGNPYNYQVDTAFMRKFLPKNRNVVYLTD